MSNKNNEQTPSMENVEKVETLKTVKRRGRPCKNIDVEISNRIKTLHELGNSYRKIINIMAEEGNDITLYRVYKTLRV